MKKILFLGFTCAALWLLVAQQKSDMIINLIGGQRPVIAIPDFRGSGEAQQYMGVFNQTLYSEIDNSGVFKVVSSSMLPRMHPQVPQDVKASAAGFQVCSL